jgi:hypothetical protein
MSSAVSLIVPVYLSLFVMSWKVKRGPGGDYLGVYLVVGRMVDEAESPSLNVFRTSKFGELVRANTKLACWHEG